MSVRLSPINCPECGAEIDAVTEVGGDKHLGPKDGDLSICVACGVLTAFVIKEDVVSMRRLSEAEMSEIYTETPEIFTMQAEARDLLDRLT